MEGTNHDHEKKPKESTELFPYASEVAYYKNKGFSTRAIHCAQPHDAATGAINMPLYLSSTYLIEVPFEGQGYVYGRTSSPQFRSLEMQLASLEDGKYGLVFGSGMGAISVMQCCLDVGDSVFAFVSCYGGTYRLLNEIFPHMGVTPHMYLVGDWDALKKGLVEKKPKILFFETPTNPLLEVIDIQEMVKLAKEHGTITVLDNTFATPYLQKPLQMGVDVVVHSTTKYIGGHSDVIGGALLTNDEEIYKKALFYRRSIGLIPSNFDCYLLSRSLKTLAIRVEKQCDNAMKLANYLANNPFVRHVSYPGLESHPEHHLATVQMGGKYGAMMSADLNIEDARDVVEFLSSLKLFTLAVSLGGVESLIEHPATMTHSDTPEPQRLKAGITNSLIRISVGLEDVEDLIADFEEAVAVFKQKK